MNSKKSSNSNMSNENVKKKFYEVVLMSDGHTKTIKIDFNEYSFHPSVLGDDTLIGFKKGSIHRFTYIFPKTRLHQITVK